MHTARQVGAPQRQGTGWFVPSGHKGVGYFVERLEGRWRCTCPSFRWQRTKECKHIGAVRALLAQSVEA
jgi:hypothetical protein